MVRMSPDRRASALRSWFPMWNFFHRHPPAAPDKIVLRVEVERETDGRWIADVIELPGVLSYGSTQSEAVSRAAALAFRVIAERLEHGEALPSSHEMSVPIDISLQPA